MTEALLTIENLRVQMDTPQGIIQPIDGLNLTLRRGEIFALVGESGCGKTLSALSINGLLPQNAALCEGSRIILDGVALEHLSENAMQEIRGQKIGMIFQDPALALNPVLTIEDQLIESFQNTHPKKNKKAYLKAAIDLLHKVRIPEPAVFIKQYPHQLSGGMKQRVVIAMALAKSPDLLIADEPTTALDVTTQAQVLNLIKDLNKQFNMAILFITHDLGIVGQIADTVGVMYAGHLVEQAPKIDFFANPLHPYSKKLFAALPEYTDPDQPLAIIPGSVPILDHTFTLCRFKGRCASAFKACEEVMPKWCSTSGEQKVRCHWYDEAILQKMPQALRIENIERISVVEAEKRVIEPTPIYEEMETILAVEDLQVHFPMRAGLFKRKVGVIKAVDNVNLQLKEGQTLALVGESGCGKTTAAKAILRLIEATKGRVHFLNKDILKVSKKKLRAYRHECQMIFQDPYSAMDPRMTIHEIIAEGMLALGIGTDAAERQDRINLLLEQVGLNNHIQHRYVHELSGGQRQRVAIARALAVGAQLIVCDEPTSALDLSVQAQILNLLKNLQEELVISYLFITHNMGVVHYLADFVAVMYLGRIVEYGPTQAVLATPKHPYTQALLDSIPTLKKANETLKPLQGEIPSPINPPAGCHFAPRCPFVHARCLERYPDNYLAESQEVRCYLYSPEEQSLKNTADDQSLAMKNTQNTELKNMLAL